MTRRQFLAGLVATVVLTALPNVASARDLDVVTHGSIEGASNRLIVSSTKGFARGDWVIVEIGKETGQGKRGTRGVGGTWPAKSYPTEAELLADRSQPNRLFAWAEDTGYTFWWLDGKWLNMAPNRPDMFYTGQSLPRQSGAALSAGTHHGDQRQHAHVG